MSRTNQEYAAAVLTDEQWRSVLTILAATARREHDSGNTALAREIHSLGATVYQQVENR